MAVYDGAKEAQDHLLDAARGVVQAYMKAPQITGRVALKSVILTGDDLLPIMEMFDELGKIVNFINISAESYRKAYEAGQAPVLVLLGADVSKSELAWDCGSCGFKTCAEFNAFSKKNRGMGKIFGGPSCNWKYMDYNVAACWACDAASRLNIENRLEGSSGLISQILGYMADCSVVNGLPLGPCTDIWYYSRPSFKVEYDAWRQAILT